MFLISYNFFIFTCTKIYLILTISLSLSIFYICNCFRSHFCRLFISDNCPKGSYQNTVGQPFCLPCTPGTINSEVGQENCKVCAAGTYMPSAASQAPQCIDCISGQYRPTTEGTSCTSCPAGTYSSVVGSDALSKCGKTCVLVFFFY